MDLGQDLSGTGLRSGYLPDFSRFLFCIEDKGAHGVDSGRRRAEHMEKSNVVLSHQYGWYARTFQRRRLCTQRALINRNFAPLTRHQHALQSHKPEKIHLRFGMYPECLCGSLQVVRSTVGSLILVRDGRFVSHRDIASGQNRRVDSFHNHQHTRHNAELVHPQVVARSE